MCYTTRWTNERTNEGVKREKRDLRWNFFSQLYVTVSQAARWSLMDLRDRTFDIYEPDKERIQVVRELYRNFE